MIKSWFSFAVYKIHSELGAITFEPFGRWNTETGLLDQRTTRILSRRRRDLIGRTISVSMVLTNNDSINHLNDYRYDFAHGERIDFHKLKNSQFLQRPNDRPTNQSYIPNNRQSDQFVEWFGQFFRWKHLGLLRSEDKDSQWNDRAFGTRWSRYWRWVRLCTIVHVQVHARIKMIRG